MSETHEEKHSKGRNFSTNGRPLTWYITNIDYIDNDIMSSLALSALENFSYGWKLITNEKLSIDVDVIKKDSSFKEFIKSSIELIRNL